MGTESGDRSETNVPDDWATWFQVSTTSESCTGARCQFYEQCFVTRARRQATDCQLIVVNHALFFADLALKLRGTSELELCVLPSYDAVVFDEAHALEDVATEYFGLTASSGRLANLANDILKGPGTDARAGTLTLHLDKAEETWWRCALRGGPPAQDIDATLVDSTRDVADYDAETASAIRRVVYEQAHGTPAEDIAAALAGT
jgi:Rad3-related DNA helicase